MNLRLWRVPAPADPGDPVTRRVRRWQLAARVLWWVVAASILFWGAKERFFLPFDPLMDGDAFGYLNPGLSKLTGGTFEHSIGREFLYPLGVFLDLLFFNAGPRDPRGGRRIPSRSNSNTPRLFFLDLAVAVEHAHSPPVTRLVNAMPAVSSRRRLGSSSRTPRFSTCPCHLAYVPTWRIERPRSACKKTHTTGAATLCAWMTPCAFYALPMAARASTVAAWNYFAAGQCDLIMDKGLIPFDASSAALRIRSRGFHSTRRYSSGNVLSALQLLASAVQ